MVRDAAGRKDGHKMTESSWRTSQEGAASPPAPSIRSRSESAVVQDRSVDGSQGQ